MAESEIRIKIGAIDNASNIIKGIKNALGGMFAGYMGMQGLQKTVGEFVKYSEEIDKANKITGVHIETLQRLKYAAEQEHASFGAVTNSLKFLMRAMTAAEQGSKNQREAFERMGIQIHNADGSLRDVGDVFQDVATRIAHARSETEASSLALQILGRSGTEVVPFMRMGGNEIKRLGDEADRMGRVLKESVIKEGEAFGDELNRVNNETKALSISIGRDLMPMLRDILKHVKDTTRWYGKAKDVTGGKSFIELFFGMGRPVDPAAQIKYQLEKLRNEVVEKSTTAFRHLGDAVKEAVVVKFGEAIPPIGEMTDAMKELLDITPILAYREQIEELGATMEKSIGSKMREEVIKPIAEGIKEVGLVIKKDFMPYIYQVGNAIARFLMPITQGFAQQLYSGIASSIMRCEQAWHKFVASFLIDYLKMLPKLLLLRALSYGLGVPFSIPNFNPGGSAPAGTAGMPGGAQYNSFELNFNMPAGDNPVANVQMIKQALRNELPSMIKEAQNRRQI